MLLFLIILIKLWIIYQIIKYFIDINYLDKKNYPPGPTKLPFFGNILNIDQAYPHRYFIKLSKKYGPIFTIWLPNPTVVITNYEILKEINMKYSNQLSGRPNGYLYGIFTGHKKEGDGIILCHGDKWINQRKFALKTFHDFGVGTNVMENKINFHKNLLLKRLFGLCDSDVNNGVVDLSLHLSYCIGNIINDLVMGRYYHYNEPEFVQFKHLIDNTLEGFSSITMQIIDSYPFLRYFFPYYYKYVKDGFKIQKFFLNEIEKHEKNLIDINNPTNFIDAYLYQMKNGDNRYLSKLTLALDAGDLWTGGMETTVTTILWGIIYLIHYPDIQKKLHDEIDKIIGLNQPSTKIKTKMPLMQAVIDEIQRIVNVLPWGIPHQALDDINFKGYKIKKGTILMPQIGAIHLNEEYFIDPETFNPFRFIDETGKYIKNPKLLPFGIGKRICLGESLAKMELFLIFTSLLQNFIFKEYQGQLPSLERSPGMTSVPKKFFCQIEARYKFIIDDNTSS